MVIPTAPDRWGGENYSPVGRGPTYRTLHPRLVRLHTGVLPDDRGFWERLPEGDEARASVWEWISGWICSTEETLARLPEDSIAYDIGRALEVAEIFWDRVSDLHDCTLRAVRRTTSADEWIYAASDEGDCYRFWPHKASEDARWYVSPVPDGDDQFFASHDFRWGIVSKFDARRPLPRWVMCVLGEPLVRAFQADTPQAFTYGLG